MTDSLTKRMPGNYTPFLRTLLICCALIAMLVPAYAQRGGEHVFTFLELPPSSRIAAMGGSVISIRDSDPAFAVVNPALLNPKMDNGLTFQYQFLFDGISDGYAAFARHFPNANLTAHAGMQFIQYGTFDLADEYGNIQGTFKANELALTIGAAREIGERLSAGANLRFVQSNFESYHSSGLLFDIGGSYEDTANNLVLAFVARNVGVQVSTYSGVHEDAPLNIEVGLSKRLEHLPFRLSITAHSLNQWNLLYDSPLQAPETTVIGEAPKKQSQFSRDLDNVFRHLDFGGEFILGKEENLFLRFGYNHQRRKELSVNNLRSFAGFSLGFGIRIKQFALDYAFASQHIAGSTQHFGISTNLERFRKGILD